MAVYKVAQDVEADDKLIGPFSFRQFIYLIIVAISIALAWGLSHVFVGLAIIPLPLIVFFGALALPLRKDQPMEVYMAALVSYYLKPRKRMWTPDGIESLIEITAPTVIEVQRTKDIDEMEAERRLSYLADIADTRGWAVRHSAQPVANNSMITDAYFEAQQTEDVLDDRGGVAQSIDTMITQADERRREVMIAKMHQTAPAPQRVAIPVADPYATLAQAAPQPPAAQPQAVPQNDGDAPLYNPYPNAIHQSVIQPLDADEQLQMDEAQVVAVPTTTTTAPAPTAVQPAMPTPVTPTTDPVLNPNSATSETSISPDIISLASNTDLSIETIQREANRIQKKAEDDGEVFISLH